MVMVLGYWRKLGSFFLFFDLFATQQTDAQKTDSPLRRRFVVEEFYGAIARRRNEQRGVGMKI